MEQYSKFVLTTRVFGLGLVFYSDPRLLLSVFFLNIKVLCSRKSLYSLRHIIYFHSIPITLLYFLSQKQNISSNVGSVLNLGSFATVPFSDNLS